MPEPKYSDKDVEKVKKLVDAYFEECEGEQLFDDEGKPMLDKWGRPIFIGQKPPTVTGLCLALGFLSRDALLGYQDRKERSPLIADAITRAKLRCQAYAESRLYDKDGANGAKFSLANNFGWKEQDNANTTNILVLDARERRERLSHLLQLDTQDAIEAECTDCSQTMDSQDTEKGSK